MSNPPTNCARAGIKRIADVAINAHRSPPALPPWIVNRLAHVDLNRIDLNHGPLAVYFEHLAHENTAKSRAIFVEADRIADSLNLDDTLLDGLLVGLNLK
jgi:hypothetical protein